MVDFVQETGRAREEAVSVVLAPLLRIESDEEAEITAEAGQAEAAVDDQVAVAQFVGTRGCRRAVMSRYMDGAAVSCSQLQRRAEAEAEAETETEAEAEAAVDSVAACDNCLAAATVVETAGSGEAAWLAATRERAREEQAVVAKLSELADSTCAYCWGMLHEVFDGENSIERRGEEAERKHSVWQCPQLGEGGVAGTLDRVRQWVVYRKEVAVCWKCGVMQKVCEQERERSGRCRWEQVVVAALCGMREAARAKQQMVGAGVWKETQVGRGGYVEAAEQRERREESRGSRGSRDSRDVSFGQWIGQVYKARRIDGRAVSNGIGVVIEAILAEEEKKTEK
jgi:hypothetical protein